MSSKITAIEPLKTTLPGYITPVNRTKSPRSSTLIGIRTTPGTGRSIRKTPHYWTW
jgi:hypothetical protein